MLRAHLFAISAADAFVGALSAVPVHQPIRLRERHIPVSVKRKIIVRRKRPRYADILRANLGAIVARRARNERNLLNFLLRAAQCKTFFFVERGKALHAGYGYGSFKLAFGFLLIIDVCLIGRMRQSNVSFRQLYQYLVFVVLHNTVWLFLLQSVPNYFVNSCIADVIYLVSIVLIVPHLDFVKLKNSSGLTV